MDFRNPLPVGSRDSVWGAVGDWPETLQAFSLTIASFAYPAAVFFGQELALFHNRAWADVVGIEGQGQKQRGTLGPDAWNALHTALHGGKPRRLDAKQLLATAAGKTLPDVYRPVLLSPLFSSESEEAVGVLAQLIPIDPPKRLPGKDGDDEDAGRSVQASARDDSTQLNHVDISELGKVVDEFPLDEHPFFHRFAEMLPSGLAILDHRAQAIFVNQLFYQLTTQHTSDKTFKSWPQSIRESPLPADSGRDSRISPIALPQLMPANRSR